MKWTKEQFCELRNLLMKDPEFKKHYMRTRGGTYGYRRGCIQDYLNPWAGPGAYGRRPNNQLPLFAKHNDIEDRDQIRRFFDAYWCFPQEEVNKYAHIPDWDDVETVADELHWRPDECPKPIAMKFNTILKAPTMTTPIEITTKTFVNGRVVSDFTNSEIFDLIAQQESEIEKLKQIKAQPKKLVKELAERQAGIAALVTYLDSQE